MRGRARAMMPRFFAPCPVLNRLFAALFLATSCALPFAAGAFPACLRPVLRPCALAISTAQKTEKRHIVSDKQRLKPVKRHSVSDKQRPEPGIFGTVSHKQRFTLFCVPDQAGFSVPYLAIAGAVFQRVFPIVELARVLCQIERDRLPGKTLAIYNTFPDNAGRHA
jgi:hypothetical protein